MLFRSSIITLPHEIIEDDVEIGAMCTIDKGVSGDTKIGAGTKIDNHVQIGHDTQVGKMCLMASQVGVAGNAFVDSAHSPNLYIVFNNYSST